MMRYIQKKKKCSLNVINKVLVQNKIAIVLLKF